MATDKTSFSDDPDFYIKILNNSSLKTRICIHKFMNSNRSQKKWRNSAKWQFTRGAHTQYNDRYEIQLSWLRIFPRPEYDGPLDIFVALRDITTTMDAETGPLFSFKYVDIFPCRVMNNDNFIELVKTFKSFNPFEFPYLSDPEEQFIFMTQVIAQ